MTLTELINRLQKINDHAYRPDGTSDRVTSDYAVMITDTEAGDDPVFATRVDHETRCVYLDS